MASRFLSNASETEAELLKAYPSIGKGECKQSCVPACAPTRFSADARLSAHMHPLSSKENKSKPTRKKSCLILTKAIPQRLYLELKGQTQQPGRSPMNHR